jgi:hypothetical protein
MKLTKKKDKNTKQLQTKKKKKKKTFIILKKKKKKKKTENHAWIKEQQNDMHELDRQYNDNSEN